MDYACSQRLGSEHRAMCTSNFALAAGQARMAKAEREGGASISGTCDRD